MHKYILYILMVCIAFSCKTKETTVADPSNIKKTEEGKPDLADLKTPIDSLMFYYNVVFEQIDLNKAQTGEMTRIHKKYIDDYLYYAQMPLFKNIDVDKNIKQLKVDKETWCRSFLSDPQFARYEMLLNIPEKREKEIYNRLRG